MNQRQRIRVPGKTKAKNPLTIETISILEAGSYTNRNGDVIDIYQDTVSCIDNTVSYKPDVMPALPESPHKNPIIEVTHETTSQAGKRLIVDEGISQTAILNFASAKNPGGGWWSMAQSQEEYICRQSALFLAIQKMQDYYDYHMYQNKTFLYSDYMIYSPKVPFIRGNENELLDQPYLCSVITSPAVNAGMVKQRESGSAPKVAETMIQRIRKILRVAIEHGDTAIVLGAFGCGCFQNSPTDVAKYFKHVLINEGMKEYFDKIVFAIYDNSKKRDVMSIFCSEFQCPLPL